MAFRILTRVYLNMRLQFRPVTFAVVILCAMPACAQQAYYSPELDALVITAQKLGQASQDASNTAVILDGNILEKSRSHSLEDLQHLVPGLSMENPDGFNVLTIRGIGGGGRNIGFDPRVGVYLDGIYMGQAQALGLPLFDVEKVEVLRGPQGNLFGRNTVAGTVAITPRVPTNEFESTAYATLGSRGVAEAFASISGPLTETLLGRVAVASEERDGFTTNLFDRGKLDDLGRSMARGQIVSMPSERLRISLSADVANIRQKQINGEPVSDLFGLPLAGGPLPGRRVDFNTTPLETVEISGIGLNAEYKLGSGDVLTFISGHRNTHQDKLQENDYGPNDLLRTRYVDDFSQSSLELRLSSARRDSVRYVVGLHCLNEVARTDRKATIGLDADTAMVQHPLFGMVPFSAISGSPPGSVVSNDGKVTTNSVAVFGTLFYDLTDALSTHLGARYTREAKRVLFNLDGSASGNFGIGTLDGYHDSRTDKKLMPTLGMTYAINKHHHVFAQYSKGFKSGGWNVEFIDPSAAVNPSFDTESVDSIEVGMKGKLFKSRLRYELSTYLNRFRDYQVFQFIDLGAGATSIQLKNAAQATARGIDGHFALSISGQLEAGIRFNASQADFKRFEACAPGIDCTGNRLPFAPGFASAVTVDYSLRRSGSGGALNVHAEYGYTGKSFSDLLNDHATQQIPSRDFVNLRLSYLPDNSRWSFNLWVRNLLDKDTVILRSRDFLGNLYVRRMEPRTAGVEARFIY